MDHIGESVFKLSSFEARSVGEQRGLAEGELGEAQGGVQGGVPGEAQGGVPGEAQGGAQPPLSALTLRGDDLTKLAIKLVRLGDESNDGMALDASAEETFWLQLEALSAFRCAAPDDAREGAECARRRQRRLDRVTAAPSLLESSGVESRVESRVGSPEGWNEEWHARLECWLMTLPRAVQHDLWGCLGALALHLGSRFDSAWRSARLGGRFHSRLDSPRLSPRPAVAPAAEPSCEWVGESAEKLSLPPYPALDGIEFALPAIPRLLPSWEELQSALGISTEFAQIPQRPPLVGWFNEAQGRTVQATHVHAVVAGGAIGAATAAIALVVFASRTRSQARWSTRSTLVAP